MESKTIDLEFTIMKRLKHCSNSSSSCLPETIWDYDDIFIEILVRLPARTLLRFKCVSKRWLSFISDPNFGHLHTLRNPISSPPSAVFTDIPHEKKAGFIRLDFLTSASQGSGAPSCNPMKSVADRCPDNVEIIQSCNGLLFCQPEIILPPIVPQAEILRLTAPPYYYVLNPTTNQFTKLMPPAAAAATTTRPRIYGYALAFDPSSSPHYKVVFLWNVDDSDPGGWCSFHHLEIYSSETKTWRLLDSTFENRWVNYENSVYWNGAVNWVGEDCEISYYHIEEERVGFVEGFPYSVEKNWETRTSRSFKRSADGHLHLIDVYAPCYTKFEVLEMGRDYSGWFVKYNVDLDPLRIAYPRVCFVLFLAKGETEEEGSSLLLYYLGKVFSYNLKSYTYKSIDLTPHQACNDDTCFPGVGDRNHLYVETLAPV